MLSIIRQIVPRNSPDAPGPGLIMMRVEQAQASGKLSPEQHK